LCVGGKNRGDWKVLGNDVPDAVCCLLTAIRVIRRRRTRRARLATRVEVKGIAYTILVGKAKEKSLLGRPRCRWKATIIKDIKNGM
jgi:hypothetical protein